MTTRKTLLALSLTLTFAAACAAQQSQQQQQAAKPSRGAAEATVKNKKLTIDYGKPTLKGRDVLAKAPDGMVWRLGMNEATQLTTSGDLVVGGKELKAGKYTLWVRKTGADAWTLAFHPKTGVWGAPAPKDGFVAEAPLKLEKSDASADELMIALGDKNGDAAIKIHWGTALLTGTFGVK
jgi:hypothetical protein